MSAIAGAAIAGAAALASSMFSQTGNYRTQTKILREKFRNDKEMWNMTNEYNSPVQQMQRLKDAGLNPNLVYGGGSVDGNTTSNYPTMEAATAPNYGESINTAVQSALAFAQLKKIDVENANMEQDTGLKSIQNITAGYDSLLKSMEYERENKLFDTKTWYEQHQMIAKARYADIQNFIGLNEVSIGNETIKLTRAQTMQANNNARLIEEKTKLTAEQSREVAMKNEAFPVYFRQSISESKSRVTSNYAKAMKDRTESFISNELLPYQKESLSSRSSLNRMQRESVFQDKQGKYYDNLINHASIYDLIRSAKFQRMSQQEQYDQLIQYGRRKAYKDASVGSDAASQVVWTFGRQLADLLHL